MSRKSGPQIVQDMFIDSDGKEFKVCLKLTEQHINAKGQTRQRVRLAAQLLSHTVGKGVRQILGETFACQSDAILTVKNFVLEFWPEYFTQALFSLLRKQPNTFVKMIFFFEYFFCINKLY